MIRVCIAGITGWTGAPVAAAVRTADGVELVAGVARTDPAHFSSVAEALDAVDADVLVDFTHASAVGQNVRAALERGVAVVVGSSGLGAEDYEAIDALARERGVGVLAAGNFSVSAALVLRVPVDIYQTGQHIFSAGIYFYLARRRTPGVSISDGNRVKRNYLRNDIVFNHDVVWPGGGFTAAVNYHCVANNKPVVALRCNRQICFLGKSR